VAVADVVQDAVVEQERLLLHQREVAAQARPRDRRQRPAVQQRGLTGVPTGLAQLDGLTGGWQPGDLILAINGERIAASRDLDRAMRDGRGVWEITLNRGGRVFTTVLGG